MSSKLCRSMQQQKKTSILVSDLGTKEDAQDGNLMIEAAWPFLWEREVNVNITAA